MKKMKLSPKRKTASNQSISVYKMTPGGKKLKKYSSILEAATVNGIDPSSISKVTKGIRNMAGGYVWQVA